MLWWFCPVTTEKLHLPCRLRDSSTQSWYLHEHHRDERPYGFGFPPCVTGLEHAVSAGRSQCI